MRFLVTGCAGFIGSHLVDRVLQEGHDVIVDNFSTGRREFIEQAKTNPRFRLFEMDLTNSDAFQMTIRYLLKNRWVMDTK
jgi:UDP-glucose 4-epimerase